MSLVTELLVPKDYGYVLLTAAGTFFLGFWHGIRVGSFRRAAGMKYPKPYGDGSDFSAAASPEKKHAIYLFNCAQRAHGNYLENQSSFALALLIAGLQYPRVAALMGVAWTLSRIAYAVGYTRKDKTDGSGRLIGTAFWLFQLGMFGIVGSMGVKMLL